MSRKFLAVVCIAALLFGVVIAVPLFEFVLPEPARVVIPRASGSPTTAQSVALLGFTLLRAPPSAA